MRPDYSGGSLVNLVASIVAARGGNALHPPLNKLRAAELSAARNVVLLIIDGLGDNYLMRRGAGGELARRRRASLTSVFPSTTASAITTSYTGRTPLEHGLTGWFTYFGEAGCVAAALPFRSRGDMLPLARRGVTPEQIFTSRLSLFEQRAGALDRGEPTRTSSIRSTTCAIAAARSASRTRRSTSSWRASRPR